MTVELKNGDVALSNFALINSIRDDNRLTPSAKLVALILASHRNNARLTCNPSYTTLEKETGYSRPTIAKALKELRQKRVIKTMAHWRGTNQYFFSFDKEDIEKISSFDRGNCEDLPSI